MTGIGALTTASLFVLTVTGVSTLSVGIILLPLIVGVGIDILFSIF